MSNCSTFLKEFRDISYCLQHLTNRSLVIIDELGRGTSTADGISLTGAICEMLIQSNVFPCIIFPY